MLSAARVRRSRDKRKSKHPEDAFSCPGRFREFYPCFCILSCWLAGYKKSEQILGRIHCYDMAQDAFSGSFDSPSVSATRESLGVAQDDRG